MSCPDIHDRPVVIKNDVYDDHTVIVTGYAECNVYRHTDRYYDCGCIFRSETQCDGQAWWKDSYCEDHMENAGIAIDGGALPVD